MLCRLLRNPAFVCVAFGGAFIGLVTVSIATFLPKYIQSIYGVTASAAATYAGIRMFFFIILENIHAHTMFLKYQQNNHDTVRE